MLKGVIIFDYVNTKINLADNFTKVVPRNFMYYSSIKLGYVQFTPMRETQFNAWLTSGIMF